MKRALLTILLAFIFYANLASVPLTISYVIKPPTCSSSNGEISLYIIGGLPPYTYSWFNGSTAPVLGNLSPGTYYVLITDANADTVSGNIDVFSSPNITAALIYTPPAGGWSIPCPNQCNGRAFIYDSDLHGIPPYTVSTSILLPVNYIASGPGSPYWEISGICSDDIFEVTVTDATGCPSQPLNSYVMTPASFNYQEQVLPACFGTASGSVSLSFTELYTNTINVTYSGPSNGALNNVVQNFTVDSLLPGNYSFNVSSASILDCDTIISVVIPDLGINCGVINGSVYLDTLYNCTVDVNEPLAPQQLIRFDPGPFFATSDLNGNYSAALPFNNYSVTTVPSLPLYPSCNVSGIVLSAVNDTLDNINLGDSVSAATDITVGLVSTVFRPGFNALIYVSVQNLSVNLIPAPEVDIYYDPLIAFISSPFTPVVNVPGHLKFITGTLSLLGESIIPLTFSTPANPALIGTSLNFYSTVTANIPEPDISNNADSLRFIIVGSYDPNDKAVDPSRDSLNSFYTDLDDEIQYRIRFQNTGNDTAFNVVVVDTLSQFLDPSTFRYIASSHVLQWELTSQNILKFHFNNILLPDSNTNEPESHGVIAFAIKPYQPVVTSSIDNRADIYFDFNPPVLTNVVNSRVTTSVGRDEVSKGNAIQLFPNPTSDYVTIQIPEQTQVDRIVLINALGNLIQNVKADFVIGSQQLDTKSIPDGLYIIQLYSKERGMQSKRLLICH